MSRKRVPVVVVAGVMVLVARGAAGQVAAGSVTGTVVDPTGLGIPGVLVTIESPMPMAGINADATGRFVINGVPPGTYSLVIQVAGFRAKELDVQVEEDKETSVGLVTLDPVPPPPCLGAFEAPKFGEGKLGWQKGRVSGTALEGDVALGTLGVRLRELRSGGIDRITRTDKNGRFQFVALPAGRYELLVPDAGIKLKVRVKNGHGLEVGLKWKNPPQGHLCL